MSTKTKAPVICPVCEVNETRVASAVFGNSALPCERCAELIDKGTNHILSAFVTTAGGGAFGRDCARRAARDIIHATLAPTPTSHD